MQSEIIYGIYIVQNNMANNGVFMEDYKIDFDKKILTFNRLSNRNIVNAFTLKPFDFSNRSFSQTDESSNNYIDNEYRKLKDILGIPTAQIIKPVQKHTNNVEIVDETNINNRFDNTDGLITNLRNVALATSLADCQGILIYDSNKCIIGNVHSGWRGTLKRIVINAIHLMEERFNSSPADIEIYICPSILQCCFEVDEEVKNLFKTEFKDLNIDEFIENKNKKYYIDTVEINRAILMKEGIKRENIITSNICTKCNSDKIHSYRVDGKNAGRNLSIIMLKCM